MSALVEMQNLYEVTFAPLPEAVAVAFKEVYCFSLKLTLTVGGVALFKASKSSSNVVILLFRLSKIAHKSQAFTTMLLQLVASVALSPETTKPLGTVLVPVKALFAATFA